MNGPRRCRLLARWHQRGRRPSRLAQERGRAPPGDGAKICALSCSLLRPRLVLTQTLDVGAALLRFEPALARAPGRLGLAARDGHDGRALDQFDQAVERVRPIALLGAVGLRGDDEHAVAREPAAGEAL